MAKYLVEIVFSLFARRYIYLANIVRILREYDHFAHKTVVQNRSIFYLSSILCKCPIQGHLYKTYAPLSTLLDGLKNILDQIIYLNL